MSNIFLLVLTLSLLVRGQIEPLENDTPPSTGSVDEGCVENDDKSSCPADSLTKTRGK